MHHGQAVGREIAPRGGTGGQGQGSSPPPEAPDANTGNDPHQLAGKKHAGEMIGSFLENEGRILVCPPCAKVRGYTEESLIEGATIAGAPAMLEEISAGAATLSF